MSYLGPVSSNQDGTIINYIPYGTIENNTTRGWSACTLTWSGNAPSGAPTLTATQMAISASSVSPLSSLYSLLLTKSAANAQYQGFVSDAFTIKREDLAKVLTGSFYYEVASGTVDMSGSSTQSLEIWVYNVNANQWIQPAGYRGLNQSSGPGLVSFTFQTDSTAANNSYRIAVITQQTSTTAYTVKFDNFKVSPQTAPIGPVVTDFQSYTATTSGFNIGTTGTATTRWRRVGDSIHVIGRYVAGGTGISVSGDLRVFLPTGLSFDTSKISLSSTVGAFELHNAGAYRYGGATLAVDTTQVAFSIRQNAATLGNFAGTGTPEVGWFNAGNDEISFEFMAPITGWSSQVQLSNDTDTRVVDFKVVQSTNQSISNGVVTKVNFGSVIHDTHGSYSSANSWYVIPVSGYYDLKARVSFVYNATGIRYIVAEKNSAQFLAVSPILAATTSAGDYTTVVINEEFYFDAGDRVYINAVQNSGGALSVSNGNASTENRTALSITRRSGPSVIAANETVAARYTCTQASSVSFTLPLQFNTRDYDTHNAVTTGAGWKFTAPVSGKYLINVLMWISTGFTTLDLYKNGVYFITLNGEVSNKAEGGGSTIHLNAGEFVDVRTGSLHTTGNFGGSIYIDITRVGN